MKNDPHRLVTETSSKISGTEVVVTPAFSILTLAAEEEKKDGVVRARSGKPRTSCVPFVLIKNGHTVLSAMGPENYFPNKDGMRFPLKLTFDEESTFDLFKTPNRVILSITVSGIKLDISITERFCTFLELTKTLGLMFAGADEERFTVMSVRYKNSSSNIPEVADSLAFMPDETLQAMLSNPKIWQAKIVVNPYLYVGQENDYIQYYNRLISKTERHVSTPVVQPICILCQETTNMNREHCTPKWLMTKLDLQPIVELVFCESCNSEQGDRLEIPMERAFSSGRFLEDKEIANMWTLKTSLTLAASQNIHVPRILAEAVKNYDPDLGGAEVLYFEHMDAEAKPEFRFTAASLRAWDRELGRFIFCFSFLNFSFFVLRWQHDRPSFEALLADLVVERPQEIGKFGAVHVLLERLSSTKFSFKTVDESWLK